MVGGQQRGPQGMDLNPERRLEREKRDYSDYNSYAAS